MDEVVRAVETTDVPAIVSLVAERIGAEDAAEAELVLRTPSFDRSQWTVGTVGGRVVSTMASFPMSLHYGATKLTGSMYEFVATDPPFERRGLVRRQLEHHHAASDRNHELFQIIVGIPYFYRRFGYEYALPVQPLRSLAPEVEVVPPRGWTVRVAGMDDTDLVLGMQATARVGVPVSIAMAAQVWSHVLASPVYATLLGIHGERPQAMARLYLDDDTPILFDVVADSSDGLAALVAAVRHRHPGHRILLLSRRHLEPLLAAWDTDDYSYAYYVRIADPVAFLDAVRPVLEARLARSQFEAQAGDGLISLYRSSIEFTHDHGRLSRFRAGGPQQAPVSRGGAGVPPDLFATLVLGSLGVDELRKRHPDFRPGKMRELLGVLFPRVPSDVSTWVIP